MNFELKFSKNLSTAEAALVAVINRTVCSFTKDAQGFSIIHSTSLSLLSPANWTELLINNKSFFEKNVKLFI